MLVFDVSVIEAGSACPPQTVKEWIHHFTMETLSPGFIVTKHLDLVRLEHCWQVWQSLYSNLSLPDLSRFRSLDYVKREFDTTFVLLLLKNEVEFFLLPHPPPPSKYGSFNYDYCKCNSFPRRTFSFFRSAV